MATRWFESIDLMYALVVDAHVLIVEPNVSQAEDALPVDPELKPETISLSQRSVIRAYPPSRLICQFPCHNRWFIDISGHELVHVILVRSNDLLVSVECIVRPAWIKLANIDIHASIIGPVISKRDDETNSVGLS